MIAVGSKVYCEKKVDNLFSLTWFGRSLSAGSGAKLWQNGSVSILNQPPYRLEIPVNWLDDPYSHRSWRWILNAFQWMDKLLADFKIKKDEELVEKCSDYFFDWADFYIVKDRKGEFLWKDDAVSFRALRLSIIADYILHSGQYAKEKKELTRSVLKRHYLELSNPKKFKSNNHGIFQMRALMSLLTLHPDIGDVEGSKEYVTKKLNWLWGHQYGKQNMHLENSTGYHQYIIREFEGILDSPEFSGFQFVFTEEKIKEVKDNASFLFHPNGVGTLFGDSNFVQQSHRVITGDHLFNEAGYAVLAGNEPTENNSYLAVRTGFPGVAHRHSDDFSFEWSEKGQVIFQDSGRFSYDYDHPTRKFVTSTLAHNTVTVNGENFPWWGSFKKEDFYDGAVRLYKGDQERAKIILEKSFSNFDVTFNRSLELIRGESLRVIDTLNSKAENCYEQWFHLAEEFEYIGEDDVGNLVFQAGFLELHVVPPKEAEISVVRGQEQPFIQGWVSYKEKHLIPRWSFGFKKSNVQKHTFDTVVKVARVVEASDDA